MNRRVRRARLLKLADVLENLQLKEGQRFDMSEWGYHPITADKHEPNMCGTAACALGWATQVPSFRKAGLKMTWPKASSWVVRDWNTGKPIARRARVVYRRASNEHAGAAFFGLRDGESNPFAETWRTRESVIERLRELADAF